MQQIGALPKVAFYAETVSAYVRMLDKFPGEERIIPEKELDYFFQLEAKTGPTQIPSHVEIDLLRFTSIRLNDKVLYDAKLDPKKAITAKGIYVALGEVCLDADTTKYCSKLLTQATFADPTVDFYGKFYSDSLKYAVSNQITTDIVINSHDNKGQPQKLIEIYYHLVLAIRDFSKIEQVLNPNDLFIQGYCLISRKICIPRSSLKLGISKDASILDSYSKFFEKEGDVLNYRSELIQKEIKPRLPVGPPPGNCIIC